MTKVNDRFDMVHGTQLIYRDLLDCMARPGKINSISTVIDSIEDIHLFSPSLIGLAYTLVDREVGFTIEAKNKEAIEQQIQWKTFSKPVDYVKADYLFIEQALEKRTIHEVLERVKHGSLEDPHTSATLLISVTSMSEHPDKGQKFILQGPGIEETRTVYVDGLDIEWIEARKKVNQEFPIGIDMILTTKAGEMMAFPRTTVIEQEEV